MIKKISLVNYNACYNGMVTELTSTNEKHENTKNKTNITQRQ